MSIQPATGSRTSDQRERVYPQSALRNRTALSDCTAIFAVEEGTTLSSMYTDYLPQGNSFMNAEGSVTQFPNKGIIEEVSLMILMIT